ncbi:MAG: hypothetical protein JWP27_347, partial [Flaviaesturariibacter sp.]|nr:hypothetical protein [Flaviaesturariibacter sp.]
MENSHKRKGRGEAKNRKETSF